MHSRLRLLLPTAALLALALLPDASAAQDPRPRKRIAVVHPGMTPEQAISALGHPVDVRLEGSTAYMIYPNGCEGAGCQDDVVIVRDCRVVGARFAYPTRRYDTSVRVAGGARPDGSCPGLETVVAQAPPAPPPPAPTCGDPVAAPPAPVPPPTAPAPVTPAPVLTPLPVATTTCLAASTAKGPDGAPLRADGWRRRLALRRPVTRVVAVPASAISSPTAFGVDWGEGFVAASYQARTRFTDVDDGAVALGLGFGNRSRLVGVEAVITSYSTFRSTDETAAGLSFKVHRSFGDDLGVAVGWENAIELGNRSDAGNSLYAVGTRVFRRSEDPSDPFSSFALSVGVGNGRFRSEDDVIAEKETINPFASLGVLVVEPVSLIADWNGQDLFAAASLRPLRRVPLVINAGFADITGSAGDGARFILSAGYGFRIPGLGTDQSY